MAETEPEPQTMQLRAQLSTALAWDEAHATFDRAVRDLAPELRGRRPDGLPHSPWEIVEHIRRAQRDILDFSRADDYVELKWPDDYWPAAPEPPSDEAWEASVAAVQQDRASLQELIANPHRDLLAAVPGGTGQSYLREALLAAAHASYHVGQLVTVRQALGAWPAR